MIQASSHNTKYSTVTCDVTIVSLSFWRARHADTVLGEIDGGWVEEPTCCCWLWWEQHCSFGLRPERLQSSPTVIHLKTAHASPNQPTQPLWHLSGSDCQCQCCVVVRLPVPMLCCMLPCRVAEPQTVATSFSRCLMTFLPLIRLMRCSRSLARWQLSLAWPKGTSKAGAASIFSKVEATCKHRTNLFQLPNNSQYCTNCQDNRSLNLCATNIDHTAPESGWWETCSGEITCLWIWTRSMEAQLMKLNAVMLERLYWVAWPQQRALLHSKTCNDTCNDVKQETLVIHMCLNAGQSLARTGTQSIICRWRLAGRSMMQPSRVRDDPSPLLICRRTVTLLLWLFC